MKEYYYIDINTKTLTVVGWGITDTADHTGETYEKDVHRIFFASAGQYNKFVGKLGESE